MSTSLLVLMKNVTYSSPRIISQLHQKPILWSRNGKMAILYPHHFEHGKEKWEKDFPEK